MLWPGSCRPIHYFLAKSGTYKKSLPPSCSVPVLHHHYILDTKKRVNSLDDFKSMRQHCCMVRKKVLRTMRIRPQSLGFWRDLRVIVSRLRAAKGDKNPLSEGELLDVAIDAALIFLDDTGKHLEKSRIGGLMPRPEKKPVHETLAELDHLSQRIDALRLSLRGIDLVVNTGGRLLGPGVDVKDGGIPKSGKGRIPIKAEPENSTEKEKEKNK